MCSGVVWRRLLGAAAWPFRPKTPYAIPNLPQTDNWPRTHGDRLARHVTAAAESEPDVLGWEHERETRGDRVDQGENIPSRNQREYDRVGVSIRYW